MELFYSTGVQILLYWGFLQGTWKNKLHIGNEKSPQKCSKDFIPSSWKFCVCFLIGRSSSAAWDFNNYQEEISRWYYLLEHRLFIKKKKKKKTFYLFCPASYVGNNQQSLATFKMEFRKLGVLYFFILPGTGFSKPNRSLSDLF